MARRSADAPGHIATGGCDEPLRRDSWLRVSSALGAIRCGVNVWYVKRGLPESQEMIDLIRKKPYFDPYSMRQLAENFLDDGKVECGDIDVRINSRQ
jgi:hypothetical protein